jgi:hypothetical protein
MTIRTGTIFLLAAMLAGCSNNQRSADAPADNKAGDAVGAQLASSVEVEVAANTVRLVLHVTNPTNRPVVLEFSSGQRYDFAVRSADGQDVWRWSADKSFMQALSSQTIAPGETIDFVESWQPGNRTGSFTATAELVATNHRLQERTDFQIRR